ncbi:HET-domain-containing protein [Ophiobolus disseminans]|uniref:HET-domain-containing protein n=1 Tax=Ophiobolus disseminans TaxID=1469910 RepID=A0A6A7A9X2_9PLEO|nr:HET-domain-containing protein [Ophiobolus disseminans]
MCLEGHPKCPQTLVSASLPLWLIDVVNMCLVTVSKEERPNLKYLALSYVWGGGAKDFILTMGNLQDYCRPRGHPTMPQTITDAITLTRRLGERLLWVDSLCIISDAPEHKATQMPALTTIYGCALVTIIAASGQDAHYGLPGL